MSERLREAARRLADTLTDQEKERLARSWLSEPGSGAGRDGGPQPPPLPFEGVEDVDLRGDQEPERLIAEWLDDELPGGQGQSGSRGRSRVRAARSAAEQAVEKNVVPSRYHGLIQRYFGRLEETVEKAESGSDGVTE